MNKYLLTTLIAGSLLATSCDDKKEENEEGKKEEKKELSLCDCITADLNDQMDDDMKVECGGIAKQLGESVMEEMAKCPDFEALMNKQGMSADAMDVEPILEDGPMPEECAGLLDELNALVDEQLAVANELKANPNNNDLSVKKIDAETAVVEFSLSEACEECAKNREFFEKMVEAKERMSR